MSVQLFDIHYDKVVYFASEHVVGRIHLVLKEPLKMKTLRLLVVGRAFTQCMVGGGGNSTNTYEASEYFINIAIMLFGKPQGVSSDIQIVAPGSYKYPFTFQIPGNCPPHFEASDGHIRYICEAIIERLWWRFDEKCTAPFTVVSMVDLNHVH